MDKIEIEHLFKDNYRQMYRLAMSILADEEESHDVVHDVFARLLDGKTIITADTATNFLLASVRNQCINLLRHKGVRERFEKLYTAQIADDAADGAVYDERIERLRAFIETHFTDRMKTVFGMRYFDNMKYQDIATALGISETAVYKHLSRCLELVKTDFKSNEI